MKFKVIQSEGQRARTWFVVSEKNEAVAETRNPWNANKIAEALSMHELLNEIFQLYKEKAC